MLTTKIFSNKFGFLLAGLFLLAIILAGCQLIPTDLTIRWTTESELDIIGFNLYRSDTEEGPYVKINEDLIPPSADPFIGGEHIYVDKTVVRGNTYFYKLETIDRLGNSTQTDPIQLTAGG